MYKYTMKKEVKRRLKFYSYTCDNVRYESFQALTQEGFPSGYTYWHVLCKMVSFVFYSEKNLREVYVEGYAIPVKFFDVELIS